MPGGESGSHWENWEIQRYVRVDFLLDYMGGDLCCTTASGLQSYLCNLFAGLNLNLDNATGNTS